MRHKCNFVYEQKNVVITLQQQRVFIRTIRRRNWSFRVLEYESLFVITSRKFCLNYFLCKKTYTFCMVSRSWRVHVKNIKLIYFVFLKFGSIPLKSPHSFAICYYVVICSLISTFYFENRERHFNCCVCQGLWPS